MGVKLLTVQQLVEALIIMNEQCCTMYKNATGSDPATSTTKTTICAWRMYGQLSSDSSKFKGGSVGDFRRAFGPDGGYAILSASLNLLAVVTEWEGPLTKAAAVEAVEAFMKPFMQTDMWSDASLIAGITAAPSGPCSQPPPQQQGTVSKQQQQQHGTARSTQSPAAAAAVAPPAAAQPTVPPAQQGAPAAAAAAETGTPADVPAAAAGPVTQAQQSGGSAAGGSSSSKQSAVPEAMPRQVLLNMYCSARAFNFNVPVSQMRWRERGHGQCTSWF
jgi:hypothetical protein